MADYTIILEGSEKKIKLLQTLAEEMGVEYYVRKKAKREKKKNWPGSNRNLLMELKNLCVK